MHDSDSWLSQSQFLVVRHAQSEENQYWEQEESVKDRTNLPEEVIYNIFLDCRLSEAGVEQACLLQPLTNSFNFADNTVYASPHVRAIETLCHMLETYPGRNRLTVVLLPLAKEVLSGYGNIPIKVNELAKYC